MPDIADLITSLKTNYLDNRGIGIRRFAQMTTIRRARLVKIFAGTANTTIAELELIDTAIKQIEARHGLQTAAPPRPH